MKWSMFLLSAAALAALAGTAQAQDKPAAEAPEKLPSISDKTRGTQKLDGFMPLYWQPTSGKLFMEISRFKQELLYQVSLASRPRLEPGRARPRPARRYRSGHFPSHRPEGSTDRAELSVPRDDHRRGRTARRRGFVRAIGSLGLQGRGRRRRPRARRRDRPSSCATRTASRSGCGRRNRERIALDESRSALLPGADERIPEEYRGRDDRSRSRPTTAPGRYVAAVDADAARRSRARAPLVRRAPRRASYHATPADPRAAVVRHRRSTTTPRRSPSRSRSTGSRGIAWRRKTRPPRCPSRSSRSSITSTTGRPSRSGRALIEGASWWNQAFEAAGFRNAFQVKVLPADADPMDIRYNMINWVHRSTRGWSYGGGVVDPRTGEIIKGNVTPRLAAGPPGLLLGTRPDAARVPATRARAAWHDSPDVDYLAQLDPSTDATAMALARIRQLSAHEVGHTLGFAHNFAASTYGRASVMDYPAPMVEIKNGKLDLSDAYATGIGAFDKFAVAVTRTRSSPRVRTRQAELEAIVDEASPTACSSSPTPTRGRRARRIRWPASGTTAAIPSRRSSTKWRCGASGCRLRHPQHPVGTPLSELEREAPAALSSSSLSAGRRRRNRSAASTSLTPYGCRRTQSGDGGGSGSARAPACCARAVLSTLSVDQLGFLNGSST